MAILSPSPKLQFFDANGNPLVGGKLYSYTAGTTSPLATYTDSTNTSANTNPIILDSRGEASVWLGSNPYKLVLYSATDVLIWSVDNVTAASSDTLANLAASGGAGLIGYTQGGTGAVPTTVQAKLRESVSVKDFGAKGDGVTDDTAAIQAALDSVATNGGTVIVPAGSTYIVSGQLSVVNSSGVRLIGQSNATAGAVRGSVIKFTGSAGSRLIDARSSYGFTLSNLYVWQSNASFAGVVVDLSQSALNTDSGYSVIKENIFTVAAAVNVINVTKAIICTIQNNNFAGGLHAVNCDTLSSNYANVINILENTFRGQTQYPLFNGGSASANWNVTGNTFEPLATNAAGALWTNGITGLTFTGNYCGDANTTGNWVVFNGGVSGATVTGNLFAAGAYGLYIQGATANQGLVVSGNVFSSIGTADVFINGTSTAYGDICNNFHYLSATQISGALNGGRYMVNASGANLWKGSVQLSELSSNAIGSTQSGVLWKISNSGTSNIPFAVKAFAGQSTTLTEWRDSAEAVVARIRTAGGVQINAPEPNYYAGYFGNTSATNPYGIAINYSGVTGGTGQPFIIAADSGATRFNVAGNGNVTNTNNSYGAISDIKLKENITDATPKLAELMQVRIVNYNLKTDPGHKQLGVISQELETIFPGMVEEIDDFETIIKTRTVDLPEHVDADGVVTPASTRNEEYSETVFTGTKTKVVKYSVFIPVLVKALQEQQAMIINLSQQIKAICKG